MTRRRSARLARFAPIKPEPQYAVALAADHPAVVEGRTLFPSRVMATAESMRFLVSGRNNPKIGERVEKGPWAGMPIYTLTLEERATCPRSCEQWRGCFGNAMPFPARWDHTDPDFIPALVAEVVTVGRQHRDGFVVRLHVLGDFFSARYVEVWARLLDLVPSLHIYGYTARRVDDADPESRRIARAIEVLTTNLWSRFAVRTSLTGFGHRIGTSYAIVVDEPPVAPDIILCPAETSATEACSTCGLCWSPAARGKTIAFLRHGMKRVRAPRAPAKASSRSASASPAVESEGDALASLTLEGIGARLDFGRADTSPRAATPEPPVSARRRRADALHAKLLAMCDAEGYVGLGRSVILAEAGITAGEWTYLSEVLRDAGRLEIVTPGKAGRPALMRVYVAPGQPAAGPAASFVPSAEELKEAAARQPLPPPAARVLAWFKARGPVVRATYAEIADAANMQRGAVSRALAILEAQGHIEVRRAGQRRIANLYRLAGSEAPWPEAAPAEATAPASDTASPQAAYERLHVLLLARADGDGVVTGSVRELAEAIALSPTRLQDTLSRLCVMNLLQRLRKGNRGGPSAFRVFAVATPALDRPPLPPRWLGDPVAAVPPAAPAPPSAPLSRPSALAERPAPPARPRAEDPGEHLVLLDGPGVLGLKPGQCRWPLDDPGRGRMDLVTFCQSRALAGEPYCAAHAKRAAGGGDDNG